MQKIKVGFDLGNNSLKIAVLRGEAVECHEYLLPENLIQEDQMTHASCLFGLSQEDKKGAASAHWPGGTDSAGQSGDLPYGDHAPDDRGAADAQSSL